MEIHSEKIKSNHEAGYARADVMLIPRDRSKLEIIMEFEKLNKYDENLEGAIKNALEQIENQRYEEKVKSSDASEIIKLDLAFDGKRALIG